MKYILFCSFVLGSTLLKAQKNITPTDHFTVGGKVKKSVDFYLKDAQSFESRSFDSIVITNHLLERKGVIKK
jgi:hypothetical protein